MIKKTVAIIAILAFLTVAGFSQTDLRIRKKTEIKMPGIPALTDAQLEKMPPAARERLRNMGKGEKVVLIKGTRMRTDIEFEKPSGMKMKKVQQTIIDQCDKRRMISFDDDRKKYSVNNYGGSVQQAKAQNTKSEKQRAVRGTVNITVTGTDTGERMKLFGYDARHLRQSITMTPGVNSCMKSPMTIDIDGWYADVPTYSCPLKPQAQFQPDGANCGDEINTEMKGIAVTGVPLKEIRIIRTDGSSVTTEEEVIELTKTSLDPALFEVPADYGPEDGTLPVTDRVDFEPSSTGPASTLAPPPAGIAIEVTNAAKKAGSVRVGIAAPTADMGNDFAGGDTVQAVRNTLAVALKNDTVETVILESGLLEQEAKQKQCDYIFYSKVTRKKGGGGLFGSMGPMLAGAAAGMIPGVGGIVASVATSTVITATSISGGFKSKDEVGFEFRVLSADGSTLIPTTSSKQKAKKNGEDVLTPLIAQAAKVTLEKIAKPQQP